MGVSSMTALRELVSSEDDMTVFALQGVVFGCGFVLFVWLCVWKRE